MADQKRKGPRIAFAVATAFTWAVATDDPLPFLCALFAAQMLVSSSQAISLPKAFLLTLIIMVVALIVQLLTTLLAERPPVLLLILGLLYFACFLAQASGKANPLVFLILVVSVMIPLLTILNIDLGSSILTVFVKSIAAGAVVTWLAYALIPDAEVRKPRERPIRGPEAGPACRGRRRDLALGVDTLPDARSLCDGAGHSHHRRFAAVATRCGGEWQAGTGDRRDQQKWLGLSEQFRAFR
jgi:hypothetical protein